MPSTEDLRPASPAVLTNAEIADRLASLAQVIKAQKGEYYKAKAYQRAAATIRLLPNSVDQMVREEWDLTQFPGIGKAISAAVREIVLTGKLNHLEKLTSQSTPAVASLAAYPGLEASKVLRIYKKFGINDTEELKEALESGKILEVFGPRLAQHVRQGLGLTHAMLLYKADSLRTGAEEFLLDRAGASRVEPAGDYRRRVEVIEELPFVVETRDFEKLVRTLRQLGGGTPLIQADAARASFALPSGIELAVHRAEAEHWGRALVEHTGSAAHLRALIGRAGVDALPRCTTEEDVYAALGLPWIPPELREGADEIDMAAENRLPDLVSAKDIRGELHAHSTSSDGRHSIEQMANAAAEFGYEYIGITDHSQSLKIAGGISADELWDQIRFIDRLNQGLSGIRVLKSAEVDILADGALDYPDSLLRELDYTVCSIHSRFRLDRAGQTERLLRAMDNRYFTILGHATGRLLLTRPGYEIDIERVVEHARQNRCFFEINSSPDRLDLSAENARIARQAGVRIAINTDAHSVREFGLVRYGVGQGRRAGLRSSDVLNCLPWKELEEAFGQRR